MLVMVMLFHAPVALALGPVLGWLVQFLLGYALGHVVDEVLFDGPRRREVDARLSQLQTAIDANRELILGVKDEVRLLDTRVRRLEAEGAAASFEFARAAQALRELTSGQEQTSNAQFFEELPGTIREVVLIEKDREAAGRLAEEVKVRLPALEQAGSLGSFLDAQMEFAHQANERLVGLERRMGLAELKIEELRDEVLYNGLMDSILRKKVAGIDHRVAALESGGVELQNVHVRTSYGSEDLLAFGVAMAAAMQNGCPDLHIMGARLGRRSTAPEVTYSLGCSDQQGFWSCSALIRVSQGGREVARDLRYYGKQASTRDVNRDTSLKEAFEKEGQLCGALVGR